jgi:thiopurine S-methyltransferase
MQESFWHDMWANGVVGFHQKEMNAFLTQHWQKLGLTGNETILVPLCGKSLDMLWLAKQGHNILGVELSQQALDEFLTENAITAAPITHAHYCGYQLEQMRLLCGDVFHLSAEDCQDVQGVYDRAAMVALPPAMRVQYVAHLRKILPKGTSYLMITMQYDQSLVQGPPFSVPEDEVRQLFAGVESIEKVEEIHFEHKGVPRTERVFVIQT